ncbi:DUF3800 domain-containing protein [Desulfofundulus kuznetsovii]
MKNQRYLIWGPIIVSHAEVLVRKYRFRMVITYMSKNSFEYLIFFDESGKNNDSPLLMGALMIPQNVYQKDEFQLFNKLLCDRKIRLHWSNYSGDHNDRLTICLTITTLMKYSQTFRFNVINYIRPKNGLVDKKTFDKMIYSKLPERIIYGLLRHGGSNMKITATIFIEDATEYKDLQKYIVEQLNLQAIYRGEQFEVTDCSRKRKNTEIGLDLTDMILGFIRNIVSYSKSSTSKRKEAQNKLIVELLKCDSFYTFLSNIRFFEWNFTRELIQINFEHYLQVFLSHRDDWLKHL